MSPNSGFGVVIVCSIQDVLQDFNLESWSCDPAPTRRVLYPRFEIGVLYKALQPILH